MFHPDSEEYVRGLSVGLSVRWCAGSLALHPRAGHSVPIRLPPLRVVESA